MTTLPIIPAGNEARAALIQDAHDTQPYGTVTVKRIVMGHASRTTYAVVGTMNGAIYGTTDGIWMTKLEEDEIERELAQALIGQYVRVLDSRGDVCGGGVVTIVDTLFVTTAQPYKHTHNGVTVEEGTAPTRFAIATHTFEAVA